MTTPTTNHLDRIVVDMGYAYINDVREAYAKDLAESVAQARMDERRKAFDEAATMLMEADWFDPASVKNAYRRLRDSASEPSDTEPTPPTT
jgi:cytochrome c556